MPNSENSRVSVLPLILELMSKEPAQSAVIGDSNVSETMAESSNRVIVTGSSHMILIDHKTRNTIDGPTVPNFQNPTGRLQTGRDKAGPLHTIEDVRVTERFVRPKPLVVPKERTAEDVATLAQAQQKRERKAAKLKR